MVRGDFKNQIGTLQSKDKKKATAVILIDETFEVIEEKLDYICDFVEMWCDFCFFLNLQIK